ncbi:alpha-glucosidase [Rhizobiales bacterium GAS113]|nr:alpha-glucosidase [Rhizobiales bacterium GAS113]
MDATAWWQDSVIYQVYPRSFQDHNGDGIGDLSGIIERADHFSWLGVDAVWFSPFFTSPMADFGYDISNYTDIDPSYGNLADFDELVGALHARGIRIILDFVPNHTSDQHPWFREARRSRRNPKRDWYTWRSPSPDGGPPNNWQSLAGGRSWEFDAKTGQYYLHSFLKAQPDLNWRNPAVSEAMHDVLRFWLDRGVDGFRVDAVGCLAKDPLFRDDPPNPDYREGNPPFARNRMVFSANRPDIMEFVAGMRDVVDARPGERVMIGEVYLKPDELASYYGTTLDGFQLPTNFNLLWAQWKPVAILKTVETYEAALPRGAWPNWVLGNHDQSRIATRIGPAQARVAMMLLLTLRGTPILYFGDELGLQDVVVPPDKLRDPFGINMPGTGQGRDPERCPMPWDETPSAGFTTGEPWLPIATHGPGSSVEAQRGDEGSTLSLTRRLLALRRSEPALSRGAWSPVPVEGDVLAYSRSLGGKRFTVILNLEGMRKSVRFPGPISGRLVLSTHERKTDLAISQDLELAANEGLIIAM